jgi:transcriptional regulator with XRE-family HTH domain
MAKKFSELRKALPKEMQEQIEADVAAMTIKIRLQALRKARHFTQTDMAAAMSVEQGSVSKLEHRDDMYVSTLRQYVRALGGELKLIASFPDADIQILPG